MLATQKKGSVSSFNICQRVNFPNFRKKYGFINNFLTFENLKKNKCNWYLTILYWSSSAKGSRKNVTFFNGCAIKRGGGH